MRRSLIVILVRYIFRRTKDLPSLSSDKRVFHQTKDMIYYAKTDLFKCILKMHLKVAPYFHRFSMYIFSWKKLHESPKSHLTNGANKICNHVSFVKKSFVRRKTWWHPSAFQHNITKSWIRFTGYELNKYGTRTGVAELCVFQQG